MHRLLFILLLLPTLVRADPADELLNQLASIDALEGQFKQSQRSPQSDLETSSEGNFKLLSGGYFSWEITAPDSQLIVATPDYLWHHDRDLETVTRRPVSSSGEMSALQILGGDLEFLRDHYRIEGAGEGAYLLIPIDIDPGFTQLVLRFRGGAITGMEITDKLAQQITVQFSELNREASFSPQDFDFQAPPEADLFYYDE